MSICIKLLNMLSSSKRIIFTIKIKLKLKEEHLHQKRYT